MTTQTKASQVNRKNEINAQIKALTVETNEISVSADGGEVWESEGATYLVGHKKSTMIEPAPKGNDSNESLFTGDAHGADSFYDVGDKFLGEFPDVYIKRSVVKQTHTPNTDIKKAYVHKDAIQEILKDNISMPEAIIRIGMLTR
jgi:hypothetical protein